MYRVVRALVLASVLVVPLGACSSMSDFSVDPTEWMPDDLFGTKKKLPGERRPVFEEHESHGHKTQVFKGWEQVKPGTMTPLQFDQTVGDLVNYMQWMGEPAQNTRRRVGVWVLIFLGVFTVIAWRLNAAFWKDVK